MYIPPVETRGFQFFFVLFQFQVSDDKKIMFANQGEEGDDAANPDPQFKPLLEELPPLVEVKTGEEEETVSNVYFVY